MVIPRPVYSVSCSHPVRHIVSTSLATLSTKTSYGLPDNRTKIAGRLTTGLDKTDMAHFQIVTGF